MLMAGHRKRALRGSAPKVLAEPPLFVRLCQTFVDSLRVILKTGFVFGAIFLVQDLLTGLEETLQAPLRSTQVLEADRLAPARSIARSIEGPASEDPPVKKVMSEDVRLALNCTFTEYRNAHYERCVDEPSDVYRHPPANPDDRGYLEHAATILLAGTEVVQEPRDL